MEGTAAKEARLAGVARAARVRAAAAALDPESEPEVAAEIVPNLLDDLPSGVLDKILGEVCQVVSTANLYRLSEVSTEFRDSPILKAAKLAQRLTMNVVIIIIARKTMNKLFLFWKKPQHQKMNTRDMQEHSLI